MLVQQKITPFLLVSLLLLVAYNGFSTFGVPFGSAMILSLPVLLFLLISPRRALLSTWCGLAFLPLLIRQYLGSSAYNVVNEGLVSVLWFAWIGRTMMEGHSRGVPRPMQRLGLLIFAVSVVSLVVNRTNPVYWLEWVFSYLLPVPVLAISRTYLKDYTPKRLLKIIILFLLFQFVLNMTWHAGINPLRNHHAWLDLSCGTYGNTAATAYLMMAVIGGGLCYLASARRRAGARLAAIVLLLLAGIQQYFTFTTHAYMFVPAVVFAPLYVVMRVRGRYLWWLMVSLLAVLLVVTVVPMPRMSGSAMQGGRMVGYSTTEYVKQSWRSVWNGPKLDVIRRVLKVATPIQLTVGMGPNSAVSYTGFLLRSPQTTRLIGEWFYTISGRNELSTGSIRENLFSGTVMLVSEIGIVGAILYLLMLVYPLWLIARSVRDRKTDSPETLFLVGAVILLQLINLAVGIVWDVWRIRMLSVTLWLLAGRVWDPGQTEEDLILAHQEIVDPLSGDQS